MKERETIATCNICFIQLLRACKHTIDIKNPQKGPIPKKLYLYSIAKIINTVTDEVVYDADTIQYEVPNGISKLSVFQIEREQRLTHQMEFMISYIEQLMNWKIISKTLSTGRTSVSVPEKIIQGNETFSFTILMDLFYDKKVFDEDYAKAYETRSETIIRLPEKKYVSPLQ